MTKRVRFLATLGVALTWTWGCGPAGAPGPLPAAGPAAGTNAARWLDAPYVVLVSSDGFGAEELARVPAPNFERVAEAGVRAERMIPTYPTKTFPTHYSMATGMYAEHHGLVGNHFWAPDLGKAYSLADRSTVQDGRFYRGEPIWVTAERQGMVAASYFWIGSEAPVEGVRPSYWYPFDQSVPYETRVDKVLEWLSMAPEHRPHMITLYFEQPDASWHASGGDSEQTLAAVAKVDAAVGRLLDGIGRLPYAGRVYVILVSDHGLMPAPASKIDRLDMSLFPGVKLAESGPYASLFIDEGGAARGPRLRDSLAALLPMDDVWLRADVPARLHYSADPRIGDILISAAPGRRVLPPGQPGHDTWTHGWDNALPEMSAIFLAMGPGIRAGQRIPAFESVNLYPFMAHVLGLTPNPAADGRLGVLAPILSK
jgi:predicted AlkP superfamily pyrophosphatase or phosphodiesterase